MAPRTGVVIFEGGPGEPLLTTVRSWAALDTAEKFRSCPGVDEVVVATDRSELAEEAAALGAAVYPTTSGPFHFGRTLVDIVGRYHFDRVVYLGGGSAPLLQPDELGRLLEAVAASGRVFVANNAQSPDLVGLGSAEAAAALGPLETDNATLFALTDAGYRRVLLPDTATVGFDLDTPSDVLILAYVLSRAGPWARSRAGPAGTAPAGPPERTPAGPRLTAGLPTLGLDFSVVERAAAVLARRDYPTVTLIGRVSGPVISDINSSLLVRLRVYSEERGMKALGLVEGGQVRSLLAVLARELGTDYLVECLASLSEAVFWDTRVLMAALGRWPDEADRFAADLGAWERVKDPELAALCRAAARQDRPFVLGGHSVVAGGLRLLVRTTAGGFPGAGSTVPTMGG